MTLADLEKMIYSTIQKFDERQVKVALELLDMWCNGQTDLNIISAGVAETPNTVRNSIHYWEMLKWIDMSKEDKFLSSGQILTELAYSFDLVLGEKERFKDIESYKESLVMRNHLQNFFRKVLSEKVLSKK